MTHCPDNLQTHPFGSPHQTGSYISPEVQGSGLLCPLVDFHAAICTPGHLSRSVWGGSPCRPPSLRPSTGGGLPPGPHVRAVPHAPGPRRRPGPPGLRLLRRCVCVCVCVSARRAFPVGSPHGPWSRTPPLSGGPRAASPQGRFVVVLNKEPRYRLLPMSLNVFFHSL